MYDRFSVNGLKKNLDKSIYKNCYDIVFYSETSKYSSVSIKRDILITYRT